MWSFGGLEQNEWQKNLSHHTANQDWSFFQNLGLSRKLLTKTSTKYATSSRGKKKWKRKGIIFFEEKFKYKYKNQFITVLATMIHRQQITWVHQGFIKHSRDIDLVKWKENFANNTNISSAWTKACTHECAISRHKKNDLFLCVPKPTHRKRTKCNGPWLVILFFHVSKLIAQMLKRAFNIIT